MKQLIAGGILMILFFAGTSEKNAVYVCASKNAKKYHFTKSCRGLNACQNEVLVMDQKVASSKGKTLCGWEDNVME